MRSGALYLPALPSHTNVTCRTDTQARRDCGGLYPAQSSQVPVFVADGLYYTRYKR